MPIKPFTRAPDGETIVLDASVYNRIVDVIEQLADPKVVAPLLLKTSDASIEISIAKDERFALVKITGQTNPESVALGTGIYACEILNPSKKLLDETASLDEESTADVPTDSKYYGYAINPIEVGDSGSAVEPGIYAAWYWTTAEDSRPVLVLLGSGDGESKGQYQNMVHMMGSQLQATWGFVQAHSMTP